MIQQWNGAPCTDISLWHWEGLNTVTVDKNKISRGPGGGAGKVRRPSEVPFTSSVHLILFPRNCAILKSTAQSRYNYFPHFKYEEPDVHSSSGTRPKLHSGKGQNAHLDSDQPTSKVSSSSLNACPRVHYTSSLADLSAALLARCETG